MRTCERVVSAVVVVMTLASCGQEEAVQPREPSARPVKLMTVGGADSQRVNRYPAVIAAAQLSELSFQTGGLLQELPVSEARSVEQGALIAGLDPRDFRNAVDKAEAQFDAAEQAYQRAVRLAREDAIAQRVLEERRSQRDVAGALLDSARKTLSDTVLRAPFSGVIANVPVRRLQTVQAGQVIATLMSKGMLKATMNVPARIIARFNTRIDKGLYVILDAAPESRIDATFSEASLIADSTSQTYAVTVTFEPPGHLIILPGMTATVETVSVSKDARGDTRVAVPIDAVVSDGNAPYVWVVDTDTMTVSKRRVTVEDGIGETVVVTDGVGRGDTIAAAGAAYLADGMTVRAWTP